jgi:hypothetical protein
MVTKKTPQKIAPKLVFRKEWIFDPAPELKKQLSPAVLKQLEQAKKEFGARVNEILKGG